MAGIDGLVPIGSITLTGSQSSVSFGSLPQSFRDLRFVFSGTNSGSANGMIQINGDTNVANYYNVRVSGNGSSALYGAGTGFEVSTVSSTACATIIDFLDYSQTDRQKPYISRGNSITDWVMAKVFRWTNTAAITSFVFSADGGTFQAGSTFNLFGVRG